MLSHCLQDEEGHEDKEEEEEIEMLSQCPQDEEVVPLSLQFIPEKTRLRGVTIDTRRGRHKAAAACTTCWTKWLFYSCYYIRRY